MANKNQRYLAKRNLSSVNGGAFTTISQINHGTRAFLEPAQAIDRLKERGSRSWKISKRHPANPTKKDKR